uniref:R-spondin 4 n=1 Tax=Varanus komodoensis TaxID=61221 RepID=A0A8D2L628_VARKO
MLRLVLFLPHPVSAALFENCTGCVMCSEENGCISCQQRLFLLIWRDGIRQNGACVHACPPGYFGVRGQEVNRCIKCKSPSCDSCFSKDFCMKCKERFYLHKGKCLGACPPSTTAQHGTREVSLLLSPYAEKCEMGPWGDWGPCTNQGRTCGSRWGSATRVREVVGSSKEDAAACPGLSESRKCRMKKHCPGGEGRGAGGPGPETQGSAVASTFPAGPSSVQCRGGGGGGGRPGLACRNAAACRPAQG